MNNKLNVKVIETNSQQELFSCPLDEAQKAYIFAAEMESLGLDITVVAPTLSETLGSSLGHNNKEINDYKDSLLEEIDQHEGSCCFEEKSSN